jgi:selenophosphate synthetase-related protein
VVEGIASYGNAIGVPTVGGEIAFHPSYAENPLVNVMALGLLRHEDLQSGTVGAVGHVLLYVGAKTGRDGLGGAVFASADLSAASDADRPAVQVGDPFLEKLLLEACLEAIAAGLVAGIQDMGAAGLTSSVGEMAHRAGLGVDLDVGRVPRRERGMTPLEVMLSESQERMVLTAAPGREDELIALLRHWELDVVPVGVVRDHGRFRVFEGGVLVADMPVGPLNEAPTYVREGVEDPGVARRARAPPRRRAAARRRRRRLLALLADPSIASKRAVYERYDHQVMTNTVVLPGAGDAAVMRIKGSDRGVAATIDCNARYVGLAPRRGAALAVVEAARNLAAVGATPLGVTDNLNFGNPTVPEVYFQMQEAVEGLREACLALRTPVTGGNVSLYNQYRTDDGRARHPPDAHGRHGGRAARRSAPRDDGAGARRRRAAAARRGRAVARRQRLPGRAARARGGRAAGARPGRRRSAGDDAGRPGAGRARRHRARRRRRRRRRGARRDGDRRRARRLRELPSRAAAGPTPPCSARRPTWRSWRCQAGASAAVAPRPRPPACPGGEIGTVGGDRVRVRPAGRRARLRRRPLGRRATAFERTIAEALA